MTIQFTLEDMLLPFAATTVLCVLLVSAEIAWEWWCEKHRQAFEKGRLKQLEEIVARAKDDGSTVLRVPRG